MKKLILILTLLSPAFALAEEAEEAPAYHNPRGAIVANLLVGVAVGGNSTQVAFGAGVGYAVLTGVLPGLRGMMIVGDSVAGEVAATLTLTPPLSFFLVPFAYGEVGRRFDALGAWMLAGGPGLYVGDPRDTIVLQGGWIFRRYFYENVGLDGSGPLISLSIKF